MNDAGGIGTRRVRWAPFVCAGLAAAAALPGLWFPFLSDDWHLVESVRDGAAPGTAFDYFRPLYMASYWLDLRLWGLSPALFHLTNLLLIAACAALVVVVLRRYTADPSLAALAGVLFALHPYHVENAAWIAVRGDPLYGIFFLAALWAYDRWRPFAAGVPLLALALFETSLLAKESAVVLPVLIVVIGLLDRSRRPGRGELVKGIAPLCAVALAHFFVLRPFVLRGQARTLTPGLGLGWIRHALGFAAATIVPVDGEILAAHPLLWGGLAAAALAALLGAVLRRTGRLPWLAGGGAAAFATLLLPSMVGFQERYLFLPAAASGLALATLVRALRGRGAIAASAVLLAAWTVGIVHHWSNWNEAASASRRLVADLVQVSLRPEVERIVLVNAPFRVRGGSVAGDFRAAIALSGGSAVSVKTIAYVSYPAATDPRLLEDAPQPAAPAGGLQPEGAAPAKPADGGGREAPDRAGDRHEDLEGIALDPAIAIEDTQGGAIVRLIVPDRPFSHFVGPLPPPGQSRVETELATLSFEAGGRVSITGPRDPRGRTATLAWSGGDLRDLTSFAEPAH